VVRYRAIFSVDILTLDRIGGNYDVEGYEIRPCLMSEHPGLCSNLLLLFPFEGVDESGKSESKRIEALFQNRAAASRKAKIFIAWLVCATRKWARLSSQTVGPGVSGGPSTHLREEDYGDPLLDSWKIDRDAIEGEFTVVRRPCFAGFFRKAGEPFKIPSDFPSLTRKLFSLQEKLKAKFLNACFSYQFALENWSAYPTVSVLALVSSIESMMWEEISSQYCEHLRRRCVHKKDIMKKFRSFFERTIANPLPRDLKKFLDNTYSMRSDYVHRALLEGYGIRGAYESEALLNGKLEPIRELRNLERLVNAALIQWLIKI
jgi:hypothetical protein